MILKTTPKMPEHASNIKNIKFEIRNNKLDQLQGMSAKIRSHFCWHTLKLI